MISLSLRLKTIATLVPFGARVCDVGTDHAYLPIYLKQSGIASSVLATDLNQNPLENAQKNILLSGADGISLRLCDGLSGVKENEADTIIIAGMGGEVITEILKNCVWIKNERVTLILQPTTSAEFLREFLCKNGFAILSETPVCENGKLYSVMNVRFKNAPFSHNPAYYYIGEIPHTKDGILYLKKQQKRVFGCMKALENIKEKQNEYLLYKTVFDSIESFLTENADGT